MSQIFLPWLSSILYNRVLDVAWSREHDEHFRIGHLNAKLRTDHDFLEQFFCFDFFKMAIFKTMQTKTSSAPPCTLTGAPCCWQEPWLVENSPGAFLLVESSPLCWPRAPKCAPVVVIIWRLWQQIKDLLMKKFSQENRDPFITLYLNVQFWSAHHVHGTKLHPKRG